MADGLNKVILLGTLGADPEFRATQGGQGLLRIRMATNESFVKEGRRETRAEWHTVVVWGKRAEALSKILQKGRTVMVEGKLQTRSWEDKDGNKRYSTEVNAWNVILCGGRSDGGGGGGHAAGPADGFGNNNDPFGDDDVPF